MENLKYKLYEPVSTLGLRRKNYWFFNNYADISELRYNESRFEVRGLTGRLRSFSYDENFKNIIKKYWTKSDLIMRGKIEMTFDFPYNWEHNKHSFDILHCYFKDAEFVEDSINWANVRIRPYLKNDIDKDFPYFHPDIEQLAKKRIEDLLRYKEYYSDGLEGFFNFHLNKYEESSSEFMKYVYGFMLLYFPEDSIKNFELLKEFKKWYDRKCLELGLSPKYLASSIEPQNDLEETKNKIKVLCDPATFGHIILELYEKQYIDLPKRQGDMNFSATAKQLLSLFDIDTTHEYLAKCVNSNSNSLSEFTKQQITIPLYDKKKPS